MWAWEQWAPSLLMVVADMKAAGQRWSHAALEFKQGASAPGQGRLAPTYREAACGLDGGLTCIWLLKDMSWDWDYGSIPCGHIKSGLWTGLRRLDAAY